MDEKKEELMIARRFLELARAAYYRTICVYTDFLNLNEVSIFHSIRKELPDVPYSMYGGFSVAERVKLCFHGALSGNGELILSAEQKCDYPISCLKISPVNAKFGENLTHRDYLGAVLNLGIDRAVIGDILVKAEHPTYLFCDVKMADFLCENLERIRHTQVRAVLCREDIDSSVGKTFETIHTTVSSMRLDTLVSAVFRESRSSMCSVIMVGKVFVNGREERRSDYLVKPCDIVSVRGYGKFRMESQDGITKKGRWNVTIEKYV